MKGFAFGRKARRRDPAVPHYSALIAGRAPPAPPKEANWMHNLPSDLGMMLNDTLGDCTCAGISHGLQVWTGTATPPMFTNSDAAVRQLYEKVGGYVPGNPSTDNGCDEQSILAYCLKTGIPTDQGAHKIAAYLEVDPTKPVDVKSTIANCGFAYIGFNVPAWFENNGPPEVWDVNPSGDQTIVGGHCVILAGYAGKEYRLISWGQKFGMTQAFFDAYVDETYALVDRDWIEKTGLTPGGLSLAELEAQMGALRRA